MEGGDIFGRGLVILYSQWRPRKEDFRVDEVLKSQLTFSEKYFHTGKTPRLEGWQRRGQMTVPKKAQEKRFVFPGEVYIDRTRWTYLLDQARFRD